MNMRIRHFPSKNGRASIINKSGSFFELPYSYSSCLPDPSYFSIVRESELLLEGSGVSTSQKMIRIRH